MKISDAEMEIMKIIWDSPGAVTAAEIAERLDTDWKQTTILTFLKRLCNKHILSSVRVGRVNYYKAEICEGEYKSLMTTDFMNELHSGSVKSFLAALYGSRKPDKKDIEEIREWFNGL